MATANVLDLLERNIEKSALLSRYQMPKVIPLHDVIRVLNEAKISFVLVGAHALAAWTRKPRATEDVDVVVAAKHLKKATKALLAAFPELESVDLPVVVRLRDRETKDNVIDIIKPVQEPYQEAFAHTRTIKSGRLTYRIPSLEMALAMKFSAITSLYRADDDKLQDAVDFIRTVKENPDLDREKLAKLASLVYLDGGKDILEMVRQIQAGERLTI